MRNNNGWHVNTPEGSKIEAIVNGKKKTNMNETSMVARKESATPYPHLYLWTQQGPGACIAAHPAR